MATAAAPELKPHVSMDEIATSKTGADITVDWSKDEEVKAVRKLDAYLVTLYASSMQLATKSQTEVRW